MVRVVVASLEDRVSVSTDGVCRRGPLQVQISRSISNVQPQPQVGQTLHYLTTVHYMYALSLAMPWLEGLCNDISEYIAHGAMASQASCAVTGVMAITS